MPKRGLMGGKTFTEPKAKTDHRRLTPMVEESLRERIRENPHYAPTVRLLLAEVDALRAELAAALPVATSWFEIQWRICWDGDHWAAEALNAPGLAASTEMIDDLPDTMADAADAWLVAESANYE